MPFLFKILFSGLIAFAPDVDQNEMMAVLVDSGDHSHMIEHLPRLEINCGNIVDMTMRSDCVNDRNGWTRSDARPTLGSLSIKDRDVVIKLDGVIPTTDELRIVRGLKPQKAKKHQEGVDETDFDWIPSMSAILDKKAFLDPSYFQRPLRADLHGLVDGRVRLTKGRAGVEEVRDGVWEFRADNGYLFHAQEAASEVGYEVGDVKTYVRLVISKFDGRDSMEIELRPLPGSDRVEVHVTNEPLMKEYCARYWSATFHHFERYFAVAGLTEADSPPMPRSYEVKLKCGCNLDSNEGCGTGPIICMDTQFMAAGEFPVW